MLVGFSNADDAGVYQLSADTCLVQTADFITPVVDDPYDFGWIAAANSLSDVYAMGARPLTCLNLVCYDTCNLDSADLRTILQGAADAVQSAGAVILGGHTVEAPEMKFGLSVTGIAHPQELVRNSSAKSGHHLILTKKLGTGIITTAHKAEMASPEAMNQVTASMRQLNDKAARIMLKHDVSAATDITGFGLLGHALEMARGSNKTLRISISQVPVVEDAVQLAAIGMIPAGSHANLKHVRPSIRMTQDVDSNRMMILADAQTSGGLLIAVPPTESLALLSELSSEGIEAAHIGDITDLDEHYLHVTP